MRAYQEEYADKVLANARVSDGRLREVLAKVRREDFLPPGPWWLPKPPASMSYETRYERTPDADVRHLYSDTSIALDPEKDLANGTPSFVAKWLSAAEFKPGDRVFHIGAGAGYYTAIIAELVGPTGEVLAVEYEPDLADRARQALKPWPQVKVVSGDGTKIDPGPRDVIFFNTGAPTILPIWIDRLEPNGRLVLPLTISFGGGSGLGKGTVFVFTKTDRGIAARFLSVVVIYTCQGLPQDADPKLWQQMGGGQPELVRQLRMTPHEEEPDCWLHGRAWCLSTKPPG